MRRLTYGFRKKLLLFAFVIIASLGISFAVIMAGVIAEEQAALEDRYIRSTRDMGAALESVYEDLEDKTEEVITDSYIQSSIYKDSLTSDEKDNIKQIIMYKLDEYIDYFYYVSSRGEVLSYKKPASSYEELLSSEVCTKAGEDYSGLHFIWTDEDAFIKGGYKLCAGRNVRAIERYMPEDKLCLVIKKTVQDKILSAASGLEQTNLLFSDEGRIVAGRDTGGRAVSQKLMADIERIYRENRPETKGDTLYTIESGDGRLCLYYDDESTFTVGAYIADKSLYAVLFDAIGGMLILMTAVLILSVIISIRYADRLSRPIADISGAMSGFNMDSLTNEIHVNTNSELDEIGESYNAMLGHVSELMQKVRYQENELRDLEMESLMDQIHPHFLYNTLENIYMLARLSGQEKIMIMVDSLSRYLRISLSNGNDYISIKQELSHARSYMEIMKIRNSELFDYEISCEDSLGEKMIPKMILQPMIENSIKHGFIDISEGGFIRIDVHMEEGRIIISEEDNGCGMSSEEIKEINAGLANLQETYISGDHSRASDKKDEGGYGLINVARRLYLAYRDKVSIAFSAANGVKFTVTIREDEVCDNGRG